MELEYVKLGFVKMQPEMVFTVHKTVGIFFAYYYYHSLLIIFLYSDFIAYKNRQASKSINENKFFYQPFCEHYRNGAVHITTGLPLAKLGYSRKAKHEKLQIGQ